MTAKTRRKGWTRLNVSEHDGVVVRAEDGQHHSLPTKDVLHACKASEHIGDLFQQIMDLRDDIVYQWICDHRDQIDRAYFDIAGVGEVTLLVVRKEKLFDPDFQDSLSNLDLSVMQQNAYDMISFRSISLPLCSDESVSSFIDINQCWVFNFA